MDKTPANAEPLPAGLGPWGTFVPRFYLNFVGNRLLRLAGTARDLSAFMLITLGVMVTKWNLASNVIHPLIRTQIFRAGLRLFPIVVFVAFMLGFVIIGQTVSILSSLGAQNYTGTVMVTVVVRELGPLVTAVLVLVRVGTATVIELGMVRARGEVEALEALGIDPIHYLVLPRVVGLAAAVFSLTIYMVLITLSSGYLFAFLQDISLRPGQYIEQLMLALRWEDFWLLALKTLFFGVVIAVVTCYEGLARPLQQDQVSEATTRAVVYGLELCVLLDALFMLYLLV